MPSYKGHLAGGFITYCVLLFFFIGCVPSLITGCEWLLFTLSGALFPDIDIKSKGQKYFYYFVFIIFLILASKGLFKELSCFSFIVITPMLTKHRGIFHNIWFLICVPLLVWMIISVLFPVLLKPFLIDTLFFISGALSHIFLDRRLRVFW